MAYKCELEQRETIVNVYKLNEEKGKAWTVNYFKKQGLAKSTVYHVLKTFEKRGSIERKSGSGRQAEKVTSTVRKRLIQAASDKKGVSSRKLGAKFGVDHSWLCKVLKKNGVKYFKRQKAPATVPGQAQRQQTRARKLSRDFLPAKSSTKIVMDDESYFTLKGDQMPSNLGFYSANKENTPSSVKYRFQEKYPTKVCVWAAISEEGVSDLFFVPSKGAINAQLYQDECIVARLVPFLEELHEDGDYLFWPDLASAHYAKATIDLLKARNINFVPKDANPPAVPQIRPVEKFWGLLKQKVYAGDWEADTVEQLKRRVRKCVRELDMEPVQSAFAHLKTKIRKVADHGALSLLN